MPNAVTSVEVIETSENHVKFATFLGRWANKQRSEIFHHLIRQVEDSQHAS